MEIPLTLQQEVEPQHEQELHELIPLEAPVSGMAMASPKETTWRSAKSPASATVKSRAFKSRAFIVSTCMVFSLSVRWNSVGV